MPDHFKTRNINRVIDANINRLKEGLRVCEEITRFLLNEKRLTEEIKKIRHGLEKLFGCFPRKALLEERKISLDVGREICVKELERKDTGDIFFANMQRAKESTRVLEEFSKLSSPNTALGLKRIRYRLYEIEKRIAKKIPALRDYR